MRETFGDSGWAETLVEHYEARAGKLLYFANNDLALSRDGYDAFALTLAAWSHGIPQPAGWDDAHVHAMADWITARRSWPGSPERQRRLRLAMLRLDGELYRHLRQLEEAQWDRMRAVSRYRLPPPLPAERLHRDLVPDHPEYTALRAAYVHYMELAEAGALDPVADLPAWSLRRGRKHDAIPSVRRRLGAEGFAPAPGYEPRNPRRLDRELSRRLRHFQKARGLDRTGKIDADTAEVLSQPPDVWLRRLELGLARWHRAASRFDGDRLRVNIPQFELQLVEDGAVSRRFKAIVGKVRTRTPLKTLVLGTVNVRPTYFGTEGRLPVAAGSMNPLGPLTLRSVERGQLIYMHGTNEPHLFKRPYRAFSHGCIRVDDPVALASHLLDRDPAPASSAELTSMLAAEQKGKLRLSEPVTAYLEYNTTFAPADGHHVVFARDVYFQDVHPMRRMLEQPLAAHSWALEQAEDDVAVGQ